MPPIPSTLADEVARLGAATTSVPAPVWLPDAVHALILACLARLFGRLEEMIRLWQAGLLPPPPALRPRQANRQPRRPATFQVSAPRTPATSRHSCVPATPGEIPTDTHAGSPRRRTAPSTQPGFVQPAGQTHRRTHALPPSRSIHGAPHPQAHGPPFKNRQSRPRERMPISLRYRIYQRIPTTADFGNRSVRHNSPVRLST
jgi:hypothetical protein